MLNFMGEENLKSENKKIRWFLNIFIGFVGAVITWGVFLVIDWIDPLLGLTSKVFVTPLLVAITSIVGSGVAQKFNSSSKYIIVFLTIVITNSIFIILFWLFGFFDLDPFHWKFPHFEDFIEKY
jgi:lipoprotein signal peptidase